MPNVLALQHHPVENPGILADALSAAGVGLTILRSDLGQTVPTTLDGFDALLVMGGPMGVYERESYPFLADEMRLIEGALQRGAPILGICLGSQLLASALGATVRRGERREIGWRPVTLTEAAAQDALWRDAPSDFMGFHWHGDVFDLPSGSVALASSEQTPLQAFRYGRNAYGVLSHPEVNETLLRGMVTTFADELREAGENGAEILRAGADYLPALNQIGGRVFTAWAAQIAALV